MMCILEIDPTAILCRLNPSYSAFGYILFLYKFKCVILVSVTNNSLVKIGTVPSMVIGCNWYWLLITCEFCSRSRKRGRTKCNKKDDSYDSSEIRRNILRRSFSRNFTERHIHIDVRRKNMYNLFFLKNAVRHNYSIIIFILVHTYIRTIRTYVFSFLVNLSYRHIYTGTYIRTNDTMVFVVPYVRYIVTILIPYCLELKVTGAIFQVYRIW